MKIQIDGTSTINKGAELMLNAVLEQIEGKYPKAKVVYNSDIKTYNQIETNLNLVHPFRLKRYPKAIFRRFGMMDFFKYYVSNGIDVVLDAGGFQFGDQWELSDKFLLNIEKYYNKLKRKRSKVIFLPQAFGPFETNSGRRSVQILSKYADLIIPRESVSKKYLLEAGSDISKIKQFPDFTAEVKGIIPEKYRYLKDSVCIILNRKMITHTTVDKERYFEILDLVVRHIKQAGREIFLLNHETKDINLCKEFNKRLNYSLPIVSGLNAKEIKGVIGISYMVISSRYHGVASALNQSVPCLSTSWSHKYELLFRDFGVFDKIIDIKQDKKEILQKVDSLLSYENNKQIKEHLELQAIKVKKATKEMWKLVWDEIEQ